MNFDANNAWQTTVYDLNDPNNRGIGNIDNWVVLGGTGASDDFARITGHTCYWHCPAKSKFLAVK
jgi:hypothetical protein